MRGLLIFVLCVAAVHSARLERRRVNKPVAQIMQRVSRASPDADHREVREQVLILNQEGQVNPDGSYHTNWESANGIKVSQKGTLNIKDKKGIVSVEGELSYKNLDGKPVVLSYTADENGYRPKGEHLPTPPPIPEAIVRALQYIKDHPYTEPKENGRSHIKSTGKAKE